jgi:hypothetical protein
MPQNNYDYAHQMGAGQVGAYRFVPVNGSFIQFMGRDFKDENITGWKTHLSVSAQDVQRATDIVLSVYHKYGGQVFKVTTPKVTADFADPARSGGQAGKMFTLYDAGEKNWPAIIHDIEQRFQEAGIKPGPPVVEDAKVAGSQYSYRRNDRDPSGEYVAASDARRINPANPSNPYNQHDPLAGFQVQNQPRADGRAQPEVAQRAPQNPVPPGGQSRTNGPLESASVYHDLHASLGDNVRNVSVRTGLNGMPEYVVTIPSTFSRSEFARAGINGANLERTAINGQEHQVVIPAKQLPQNIQRDAAFFHNLEQAGLPVNTAYRTGNGSVNAYVVEVPASFSRGNLASLGIDPNQIQRRAGSNGNYHEMVIPVAAAQQAGMTTFTPPARTAPVRPSSDLIAQQEWQPMSSPREGAVMRADASGMNEAQRNVLLQDLKAKGIDARVVHSNTFNRDYVQVQQHDFAALDRAREPVRAPAVARPNLAAQQNWQAMSSPRDGSVMRADASGMNEAQRNALLQDLKTKGIDARVVHSNTFNRDYVQVQERDFAALERARISGSDAGAQRMQPQRAQQQQFNAGGNQELVAAQRAQRAQQDAWLRQRSASQPPNAQPSAVKGDAAVSTANNSSTLPQSGTNGAANSGQSSQTQTTASSPQNNGSTGEAPHTSAESHPSASELPTGSSKLTAGVKVAGAVGMAGAAVQIADKVAKGDYKGAAVEAGTGAAITGATMAAERFVPVAGQVVAAGSAFVDTYQAVKSGDTGMAVASGTEATLYSVAAGATAVAMADCWNPTVIAPAAVAVVAGGAAVTITAAKAVYNSWDTVKGWFGYHSNNGTTGAETSTTAKPAVPPTASTQPSNALPQKSARADYSQLRAGNTGTTEPARPHSNVASAETNPSVPPPSVTAPASRTSRVAAMAPA